MPAPRIGITTNQTRNPSGSTSDTLGAAYVQAVLRAGGLPLMLPVHIPPELVPDVLDTLDGLLLTGGADIDPILFNGQPHPTVYGIDAERDRQEMALVQQAAARDLPFLGICRGVQSINVALGGTLYTDIPDQFPGAVRHDYSDGHPRDYEAHQVNLVPGSRLAEILGASCMPVNSFHHQGLKRVADGLKVSAHAPDGLIEGVELTGHRFGLGVQWHPECMPESLPMQALFRAFIRAAR